MKNKILYMFITLMCTMGIATKVAASEAICVYPTNNWENANYFTVTIKDNNIAVDYNVKERVSVTNYLTVNNFTNANGELECLNKITYDSGSSGGMAKFTVSTTTGSTTINLDSSRSTVTNDVPDTQPEEEKEEILLKCSYSNHFLIKTTKEIQVELANGYNLSSKPNYDEIGESCPDAIYMTCTTREGNYCSVSLKNNSSAIKYILDSKVQDADNLNNPETSDDEDNPYIDNSSDLDVNINYESGCGIFSNSIKEWLTQVLDIIKIAALVLTLILGMLDFFKGVASGDADAMKKMWKHFSTRLIVVAILFLLPVIIEFLLGLVTINGIDSSNPLCGIK